MKIKYLIIFLHLLFFSTTVFSSQNTYDFTVFNTKTGLTQNYIKCIYQDHLGFLWIGTNNGLNKYDGYKFTHFKFNPTDSSTISNNRITSIINLDEDNILVGTDFGFNIINSVTGSITRKYLPDNIKGQISSNAVKTIFKDSQDNIYLGTFGGGLFTYVHSKNEFNYLLNDPEKKGDSSFDYILNMLEDKEGNLWIGSYGGLALFDRDKNVFHNFKPKKGNKFSLTHKIITSMVQKNTDEIWIGTIEGLNIFNKKTRSFTNYKNSSLPYFNKMNITDIHFSDSSVWLTTAADGIVIHNFADGRMRILNNSLPDYPLPENALSCIFEDESGIIWAGTRDSGLLKFIKKKKFENIGISKKDADASKINTIYFIKEDDKNNIWVGTQLGVFIKRNNENNFSPVFENVLGSKTVSSIIFDSRNNILLGTTNGFYIYDSEKEKIKSYHEDRNNPDKLKSDAVSVIYESSSNDIWLGTIYEGLVKFDYKSDTFKNFPCAYESDTSLIGYNITSFQEDADGNLWIGTLRGLSKFSPTHKTFKNFSHNPDNPNSLSSNAIISLLLKNDNLWIGTYGGGLIKYNSGKFKTYLEKDGLPSSVVSEIIYDRNNKFWISTDNGLSEFDTDKSIFYNYGFDDGLHTIDFNTGAGTKLKNGSIYFGSANGITYFNPEDIVKNSKVPKTVITSIKIFNQEKIEQYYRDNLLSLGYNDNFISVEFASMDFTNSSKNHYKYMLVGKNNQWVDLKERRYVDFVNLEPGEYQLIIKGSNNDLIWDDAGVEFSFVIFPPFWNAWWFFLIVLLIITGTVYSIHHFLLVQKTKHLLQLNQIRLEAADDFHDHVGHTLTRISLFTELLKKNMNKDNPKSIEYINKISGASSLLYNEAKDFIWSLDPKNDSLFELSVYLKDFGEDFFSRTGILFNSNEIDEGLKSFTLPMKLKREIIFIFKEVMNNALKHSKAENVFLNIFIKGSILCLKFEDDGIGMGNELNYGRGLKSIRSRSDKSGFTFTVESQDKKGTSINISYNLKSVIKDD